MRVMFFHFRRAILVSLALGGLLISPSYVSANNIADSNLSVNQQASTLRGVIVDAQTKEPIIGANIYIKALSTGAITDVDGNMK